MQWHVVADPQREYWRKLGEYADTEYCVSRIEAIHGTATTKTAANYKKQALQIRGALLQAREYFEAAQAASIYTAGNHLYYGASSLAAAIMLLFGDGTKSLDYLRSSAPSNRNHGLAFSLLPASSTNTAPLLERCLIATNSVGFFANWYSEFPTYQDIHCIATRTVKGIQSKAAQPLLTTPKPALSALSVTRSFANLLPTLPDLIDDAARLGLATTASRCTLLADFASPPDNKLRHVRLTVHNSREREFDAIADRLIVDINALDAVQPVFLSLGGYFDCKQDGWDAIKSFPMMRIQASGDLVAYGGYRFELPEFVDAYQLAFGVSMLSRYYSDVWSTQIENHSRAARLLEHFVRVYQLKLPMLALSAMIRETSIAQTYRPGWWSS